MVVLTGPHHWYSLPTLGLGLELMLYLWPTQKRMLATVLVHAGTSAVASIGDCIVWGHLRVARDGGRDAAQSCRLGVDLSLV
jgi:hypothetical protein